MSEPKRYKHTFLYGTDGFVNESFLVDEKYNMADEGEYVSYEDYARLKAEVERLEKVIDTKNQAINVKQDMLNELINAINAITGKTIK